jgi:hypothetical protein
MIAAGPGAGLPVVRVVGIAVDLDDDAVDAVRGMPQPLPHICRRWESDIVAGVAIRRSLADG